MLTKNIIHSTLVQQSHRNQGVVGAVQFAVQGQCFLTDAPAVFIPPVNGSRRAVVAEMFCQRLFIAGLPVDLEGLQKKRLCLFVL